MNGAERDDDAANHVSQLIISELKSYEVNIKILELRKEVVASCLGCFSCWFKTPGICVINDVGRDITRMLVHSDLVIFISPIVFGGYSAELKKALDRIISYLNPDLMKIQGEVHHKPRYSNRFSLIGVGISEDDNNENAQIFTNLIKRNSINFHCKSQSSLIINNKETATEIANHIKSILEKSFGGEDINV
ncbi:MAG: NAD(P)H-dependent oxidoreductase [Desulfosporosinus sp.]|nr:NAD(P)H-dependent oxidoreductase [Desulfosporosinus sp.]